MLSTLTASTSISLISVTILYLVSISSTSLGFILASDASTILGPLSSACSTISTLTNFLFSSLVSISLTALLPSTSLKSMPLTLSSTSVLSSSSLSSTSLLSILPTILLASSCSSLGRRGNIVAQEAASCRKRERSAIV